MNCALKRVKVYYKNIKEKTKGLIMKFWILLAFLASMYLSSDAKPYEKIPQYLENELNELFSKISKDIDTAEILKRLQSIMGQVVSIENN